jgi:hypothetical protein
MTNRAMMYKITGTPVNSEINTVRMRTRVTSMLRYWATPPQTPPMSRFEVLRVSFLGGCGGYEFDMTTFLKETSY